MEICFGASRLKTVCYVLFDLRFCSGYTACGIKIGTKIVLIHVSCAVGGLAESLYKRVSGLLSCCRANWQTINIRMSVRENLMAQAYCDM